MADNYTTQPGAGGVTFRSDEDVGGIHWPVVKLAWGADDAFNLTSAADPLPVTAVQSGAWSVSITGTAAVTQSGAWTVAISGSVAVTGPLTDAQLRATPVPVSGTVTANAGTNLNTSALALEAGGNLAGVRTAVEAIDDWDESDRAKVNLVVGQAGITAGAGAVAANTPRVTHASDDPVTVAVQVMDDWDEADRAKVNPIVGQAGVQGGSGAVSATTQRVVLATDVALPAGDNAVGRVKLTDGTTVATVRDLANSDPLNVCIVDGSGDQITSFGGGTQYTEDAAAAANPVGGANILVRQDTPAGLVSTDGDNVAQRGTNFGAAFVQVLNSSGAFVDTFGGGTQYTEDAAAAADPVGNAMILVRNDTLEGVTSTDGDNVAARGTDKGELYVKHVDAVPVTTVIPGTAATNLGKAEDAGHTTGDVGVMLLGVRNDADATSGGTDLDYSFLSTDAGGNQNVRPRPEVLRQQITSAGLTNAAYAAGDTLGNQFTFTNMARKSGAGGYITGISLVDEVAVLGAVDAIFFVQSVTPAADNAAASWSDADMLHCLGIVNLSPYVLGANRFVQSGPIRFPYICSGGTSLYMSLITRSANGAISAATAIKATLTYEQS